MATLLSLAKKLDFTNESEYFDYCINSYLNGNFSQCKNLFKGMTRKDRKEFLSYISDSGMLPKDINQVYKFYFNLL